MPLQLLVYHFHDAPVPKLPPDTDTVVELPKVTEAGFAVAEVGAVELIQFGVTLTVTETQLVVLEVPSALT